MTELLTMITLLFNLELFLPGLLVLLLTSLMKGSLWTMHLSVDSVKAGLSGSMVSDSLVIMSLMVFGLVWMSAPLAMLDKKKATMAALLLITLYLCFRTCSVLTFYAMFEFSLIPIFLIIMGWGYQPERLSAVMSMLMYTVLGSLPLLMLILALWKLEGVNYFSNLYLAQFNTSTETVGATLYYMGVTGMLIKLPIFLGHSWLPKAHVEAPVSGSMLLAAVLLKLGGYGAYRLYPMLVALNAPINTISAVSLVGGALTSALCVSQVDMKVLIAYSSVAHMSLVIYALLVGSDLALWAATSMMLAHGPASSGLFMMVNLLYSRSGSRLLVVNKSYLNYLPLASMFFFILCVASMGGPPTFNLLSEISHFMSAINFNSTSFMPLSLMAGFSAAYSLVLFSFTQQGQASPLKPLSFPVTMTEIINGYSHSFMVVAPAMMISLLLL